MLQKSTSKTLQEWQSTGSHIQAGPLPLQVFVKEIGNPKAKPGQTLLLLHGFPESSYSYHLILEGMSRQFERIILFDFPGYGWSDKPIEDYSYSLMEQADVALAVWKHFGVRGGHLLAHDMGTSVAAELATRQVQDLLPGWFELGFLSFTFTNGSLLLGLSSLRITQKILLSRFGSGMKHFTTYGLFRHQVKSAHGNQNLPEIEIQSLWEANQHQDGHRKAYLTIRYIRDRQRFERTRWLPALGKVKVPIHLCWGEDDAVARVEMVHHLKKEVCPTAEVTIMKNVGHFGQLGSPEVWVESVGRFYDQFH
jgi:pimeloyl-ACP methyl ester carboxylesterase